MRKTNLIDILSNFTAEEMKETVHFSASPYFNRNKNVNELFSHLKKLHPDFNNTKATRNLFTESYFPEKVYNEGLMRLQIHALNKN